jgi:molecular chaperone DnaK (HSP70)
MLRTEKFPRIVRNNLSNETSPVIISFQQGGKQRLIGEEALGRECTRPTLTCGNIKQLLGRTSADKEYVEVRKTGCPLTDVGMDVADVGVLVPQQLLGMYLKRCLSFLKQTPAGICVAVPQAFNSVQRAAIVDACRICGFESQAVVVTDDLDAAALCLHRSRLAVEKLFDVPHAIVCIGVSHVGAAIVVARAENKIEMVAKACLPVGSSNIDVALLQEVAAFIQKKYSVDVNTRPKAYNRLLKEIRKCKEMLSSVDQCNLQIDCLTDEIDLSYKLTRETLEKAAAPLLDAIRVVLSGLPKAPGLKKVELIGGGWRIPFVQSLIKELMGVETLSFGLDASSTITQGAAIAAKKECEVLNGAITDVSTMPLSSEELINEWRAVEARLQVVDEADQAAEAAKNKLEGFLITTGELVLRCASSLGARKAAAEQRLEEEKTWLYDGDDGRGAEAFSSRFETLRTEFYASYPEIPEALAKDAAEQAAKEKEMELAAEQARKENAENTDPKTDPQRLRLAQERREQGVGLFKQDHFQEATRRFVQALEVLGNIYDLQDEEIKKKRNEISLSCYLNLSTCNIKLEQWRPAQGNASKALDIDAKNPKAFYRRGQANIGLGDFEAARADLAKGLEYSGNDPAIAAEMTRLTQIESESKAREKKMFSKMFA